jgi:hypothetical protein
MAHRSATAASVKVVYEADRVILARALRGVGDADHILGLLERCGEGFGD